MAGRGKEARESYFGIWRGCGKGAGADSTPFYWGLKWPEVQMSHREELDVLDVLAFWEGPHILCSSEECAEGLLPVLWLPCLHSFDAEEAKLCLHVLLASLDLCSQWPGKGKSLN